MSDGLHNKGPFRLADTPPTGTPAVATPYDLVKLLLANRSEMALLNERLRAVNAPAESEPVPTKGPAAQVVGHATKWLLILNGALALAATVAHQFRPDLEGPIQFLMKLIPGAQ